MTDYKELAALMREHAECGTRGLSRAAIVDYFEQAADAIENLLNLLEEHNTTRPYLPRDVPDRETFGYGVYGYDYCSGVEEEDQYKGMLGYMG